MNFSIGVVKVLLRFLLWIIEIVQFVNFLLIGKVKVLNGFNSCQICYIVQNTRVLVIKYWVDSMKVFCYFQKFAIGGLLTFIGFEVRAIKLVSVFYFFLKSHWLKLLLNLFPFKLWNFQTNIKLWYFEHQKNNLYSHSNTKKS